MSAPYETPFGPLDLADFARRTDPEACDFCGRPHSAPLCESCEDERWAFDPQGTEIIPLGRREAFELATERRAA